MKKRDTGPLFLFFGRTQKRCHASSKMMKRDTPAFFSFFGRIQKRCHAASKMKQRDTGPFFVIFVAHSKAAPGLFSPAQRRPCQEFEGLEPAICAET